MSSATYIFGIVPLGLFFIFLDRFFEIDLTDVPPEARGALYLRLFIKSTCLFLSNVFLFLLGFALDQIAKEAALPAGFITISNAIMYGSNLIFLLVFLFWTGSQFYYVFLRNVEDMAEQMDGAMK